MENEIFPDQIRQAHWPNVKLVTQYPVYYFFPQKNNNYFLDLDRSFHLKFTIFIFFQNNKSRKKIGWFFNKIRIFFRKKVEI